MDIFQPSKFPKPPGEPQGLEQGSFPEVEVSVDESYFDAWSTYLTPHRDSRPHDQASLNIAFPFKKKTAIYQTLVFEGGTLMGGRLTSHYSFTYGLLLLRFRIERYEN